MLDVFVPLGAAGEGFGYRVNIVALMIPPDADLAEIKRILQRGEADGSWAMRRAASAASGHPPNSQTPRSPCIPSGRLR